MSAANDIGLLCPSAAVPVALPPRPTSQTQLGCRDVVAVVVTHNRPARLEELLDSLRDQTIPVSLTIVVDNGGSPLTAGVVEGRRACIRVNGRTNLGGAGGFALGTLYALTTGAGFLWLMDDDGRPACPSTLGKLLEGMLQKQWDATSPLVVDSLAPQRTAFPFKRGMRLVSSVSDLEKHGPIEGFAHLFNGLLIRSEVLVRTGVPDLRLFIRGDEVDFFHRMRKARLRFGTDTRAHFFHPPSWNEIVPLIPGVLHAVCPPDIIKRQSFFRNRGYIVRQHGLMLMALRDAVVYPWFFLIKNKGDLAGLRQWASAVWAGATSRF